jgi:hypothetical protein
MELFNLAKTLVTLLIICIVSCRKDEEASKLNANFTIEKSVVKKGEEIHFTNYSQNASSYLWDFGDGSISTDENPQHLFTSSGTHLVVLTAFDNDNTSTYYCKIFVKDFTVMTYNICISGGAIPEVIDIARANGHTDWFSNRMPQILSVIREVDPDILCLQEVYDWYEFDPPYYIQVADSLGMNYFYFLVYDEVPWCDLIIYSKYPIDTSSTYFVLHQPCVPEIFSGTCMIKATVRIGMDKVVDIYNCHLIPRTELLECEILSILRSLKKDFNSNKLLIGDMNFAYSWASDHYHNINFAGLKYLSPNSYISVPESIDQIWATEKFFKESKIFEKGDLEYLAKPEFTKLCNIASDHKPTIGYFAF